MALFRAITGPPGDVELGTLLNGKDDVLPGQGIIIAVESETRAQ
jgi:hypothetical protein